MKRLLIVILALLLLFSFAVSVCADTEAVSETETEKAEETTENNTALMKNLQIFMLVGAVVGALVLVAFMYKKKDEARYL